MRNVVTVAITLVWLLPGIVQAEPCPFFPLDAGMDWGYYGGFELAFNVDVEGPYSGPGFAAVRVRYDWLVGTVQPTEFLYWSTDTEGNLLLHAREVPETGTVELYNPPMLYLSLPLQIGASWTISTTVYDNWDGAPPGQPLEIQVTVVEEQDLTVPAGTFRAVRVDYADQQRATLSRWYSEGVGLVSLQYGPYVSYDLRRWSGPMSTEPATWGSLKALYRR